MSLLAVGLLGGTGPQPEPAVADQEQTQPGQRGVLVRPEPGGQVGQTFVPTRPELVRLELMAKRQGRNAAARALLWAWAGDYETTVAGDPLWSAAIPLRIGGWNTVSVPVEARVRPGSVYYLELRSDGTSRLALRMNRDGTDRYPSGRVFLGGIAPGLRSKEDLWFRTWGRGEARAGTGGYWIAPLSAPERVTRDDYLQRVTDYAEFLRENPTRCGRRSHQDAFYDAFLYRLSCDGGACREALAQASMEHLGRARGWQVCGGDDLPPDCLERCRERAKARFHWLELPTRTWEWLRNAPSLTAEQKELARALLLQGASETWPPADIGTGNRSLMAAVGLQRMARLFPGHPDAARWKGYADEVWAEVRREKDMEEDSASYALNVWWPAFIQLAAERPDGDALWRDPAWRALVERTFAATAPLGVMPGFGDGSGWGYATPGLIWLMEEAGRIYREPRYRWLAGRVWRFHASYVMDRPPAQDGWKRKLSHLAGAYQAADPSLPREAPRRQTPVRVPAGPHAGRMPISPGVAAGARFAADLEVLTGVELAAQGTATGRVRLRGSAGGALGPPLCEAAFAAGGAVAPCFATLQRRSEYQLEILADGPLDLATVADGSPWFALHGLDGLASQITRRREVAIRPRASWGRPPRRVFGFTGREVPGKLILRSGPDPGDLFVVINLLAGYRHGHDNLGALVGMIDRGSILLTETAYPYDRKAMSPEDENVPIVKRLSGSGGRTPGRSVSIDHFRETRNLTVAFASWDDPGGSGARVGRHVYFVKNRFLWVRDRFELPEGLRARVRSLWHAAEVAPGPGAHAFHVATPRPLSNAWLLRNPRRYALLHGLPHPGVRSAVDLEKRHLPAPDCPPPVTWTSPIPTECRSSPAQIVYQEWTGRGRRTVWLDTVVVPREAVSSDDEPPVVRTLAVDGGAVALAVDIDGESWRLVANPDRVALRGDELETDARYAVEARRPGAARYLHLVEATHYRNGDRVHRFDSPRTHAEGGFSPARSGPGAASALLP